MQLKDVLNNIKDIFALEGFISQCQTSVTFWEGRKFSLPRVEGTVSLNDLITKTEELMIRSGLGSIHTSYRIFQKLQELDATSEKALNESSVANQGMAALKRLQAKISSPVSSSERLKKLVHSTLTEILRNAKVHGTAMATLSMISLMPKEDERHCLIPFGKLVAQNIPCFFGELDNGITQRGVNQRGTSWSSALSIGVNYAETQQFAFDMRKTVASIASHIESYKEYKEGKEKKDRFAQLNYPDWDGDWGRLRVQLLRLRSIDEPTFKKLQPDLKEWISAVVDHFNFELEHPGEGRFAPGYAEKELKPLLPLALAIKDIVFAPAPAWTVPASKIKNVFDSTPLVFISNSVREDEVFEKGSSEYVVARNMKLGDQIQMIAVPEDKIKEAREQLKQQGFADKVSVVSLQALKQVDKELRDAEFLRSQARDEAMLASSS